MNEKKSWLWAAVVVALVGGCGSTAADPDAGPVMPDLGPEPDAGADPDLGPVPMAPEFSALGPADAECRPQSISPLATEYGHWAASRIDLPDEAFTLEAVRYRLEGGVAAADAFTECDLSLAHRIGVLTVPAGQDPPAEPDPNDYEEYMVPAGSGENTGRREVLVGLNEPRTIEPGTDLFLLVEMVGGAGVSLCLDSCRDVPSSLASTRSYWSYADETPFPWRSLGEDGLLFAYQLSAVGPDPE